jgi:hypothetical protein
MGFIADIVFLPVTLLVDIVIYIVEAVIQIVEIIIQLIMILLGWEPDAQTIEYFEVRNVALFDNPSSVGNSLKQIVLSSVLGGSNLTTDILYDQVFNSGKKNFRDFMQFIEDGNYFESFPTVESYILILDYDEVTAALLVLEGAACTIEQAALNGVNIVQHTQFYLQENKVYDVGLNRLGSEFNEVTTTPATPAATTNVFLHTLAISDEVATEDSVTVNALSPVVTSPITPATTTVVKTIALTTTDEVATEDTLTVEARWQVLLTTAGIVYNSGPDNYTIHVFNDDGDTDILPYTVPTKVLQLHYIVYYYIDSDPDRQYLFLYQVGLGTYTNLDTVESPIDIAGNTLQMVPAVPLRVSNTNYTTLGATKVAQIEDICAIVELDAEAILDEVLNDPDAVAGDIDNIYINFGVRCRDTSQAGLTYLFNMFENLFPSQGSTKGDYDNTQSGDDKPQNNIITETEDNKWTFQWSYIQFTNTTLAAIDAQGPGGTEYDIYYSKTENFNSSNILVWSFYASSAVTTYKVGFIADDLTDVADFLTGSLAGSSGPISAEAANWLQVTQRLSYNNPTPVLQDPDSSTSAIIFLTPDRVYENNGGTLRAVEQIAEETSVGQVITYYCADATGLDAYTVTAPIGALKVIDGDSGVFRTVKFNLGDEDDLMVPFLHTFVKDLSHSAVTDLFLVGAHVSIYIARYEVIQPASMSFLVALVLLIVIIIVAYYAYEFALELAEVYLAAAAASGVAVGTSAAITAGLSAVVSTIISSIVANIGNIIVGIIIKQIIAEIAKNNEELALILTIAFIAYNISTVEGDLTIFDKLSAGFSLVAGVTDIAAVRLQKLQEALQKKSIALDIARETNLRELTEFRELLDSTEKDPVDYFIALALRNQSGRSNVNPNINSETYIALYGAQISTLPYAGFEFSTIIQSQSSVDGYFV